MEKVFSNITPKNKTPLQLSILGKLTTSNTITIKETKKTITTIKKELNTILDKEFQFGYFHNPEIGFLFIAGHLTPTFLTKVDDRELASLSSGLLGIFRGLEIKLENINKYLSELKNGSYCLIIRGESSDLAVIEPLLDIY